MNHESCHVNPLEKFHNSLCKEIGQFLFLESVAKKRGVCVTDLDLGSQSWKVFPPCALSQLRERPGKISNKKAGKSWQNKEPLVERL